MLRGYGKKFRRIDSFDRWLAAHWERRDERANHASNLRHFELADAYVQLFGRRNVSVLAYEQLVREPEAFMAAAARWALRAPEFVWLRRAASALTPGRAPLRIEAPPTLAAAIAEHRRRDNHRLAAEWRLPLGDYGYPV